EKLLQVFPLLLSLFLSTVYIDCTTNTELDFIKKRFGDEKNLEPFFYNYSLLFHLFNSLGYVTLNGGFFHNNSR
ncbi:MAG: hypothetical protein SO471_12115, partial [Anaerobutyricum hallii]|uniref:hypothetical protein n=1 Tax=Anaerobutyricum hallii TaxID=39488 RepID=UPI002A7ED63F